MTTRRDGDDSRQQQKGLLDSEIRACRRCEGVNEKRVTQAAPGWGNMDSPTKSPRTRYYRIGLRWRRKPGWQSETVDTLQYHCYCWECCQ